MQLVPDNLLPRQELDYIREGLFRLGLSSLHAYYKTPWWIDRRSWYFHVHGRFCNKCHKGSRKLQLHHKTYKNLGFEQDDDVEALCLKCHHKHHKKLTKEVRRSFDSNKKKTLPAAYKFRGERMRPFKSIKDILLQEKRERAREEDLALDES